MTHSTLTDEQEKELFEHVSKKYPWAKERNIKRLAAIEIRTGRKDFGKKICNSVQNQ